MRDPSAALHFEADVVLRSLYAPLSDDDFLRSALARALVANKQLVPFHIVSDTLVRAERLPFVTYPFEWCDAQFYNAAQLTLEVQKLAVGAGYDLKDASAWNVIYRGCEPIFCDLLSLVPLRRKKWWAMGQFARHFLVPLVISKLRGLRAHQSLAVWRDGVPAEVARDLLGWSRFLTRYWPLVSGANSVKSGAVTSLTNGDAAEQRAFRSNLHASLDWFMAGVRPKGLRGDGVASPWVMYTDKREHYPGASVKLKKDRIKSWMCEIAPDWVADLGCNTGEFSRMALAEGASVIAVDSDHASIERLYLQNQHEPRLYPVLVPIDDISGGRGWKGGEFPGLMQRLEQRCDLVMMLAIVHHLVISSSVPLSAVAELAARCTRRWLIIEFIHEDDPQMQLLCQFHDRDAREFSLEAQRTSFLAQGFEICEELVLSPASRTLALLKKVGKDRDLA